MSENRFAYILQKLQDISSLGRIQSSAATRLNYVLIESISYFGIVYMKDFIVFLSGHKIDKIINFRPFLAVP